ncbi:hypothetical protein ACFPM3_13450 [Streptomyces coeruleoprunus]|uniref:Lipoprotein n=1 Tax=Streptomyces coeruleoprunus TaxID=285563 RepID=A0ABV9XDL2_9ACTN
MQQLVRSGVLAAVAVASALALTACGSGKGDEPGKGASAAPSGGASAPAGGHGAGSTLASVEGSWSGMTDGKLVNLTVSASGQAVLITEAHVCQGTAKEAGHVTLALTCKDGSTDRTTGTVESADGKQLVVAWDGGKKDTLAKTSAPMPTDLPSVLPSGMPSIPALPSLPPES